MDRICKYKDCRHEAEKDSFYCKYHLRIIEMEEGMTPTLKQLIEKLKKERYS